MRELTLNLTIGYSIKHTISVNPIFTWKQTLILHSKGNAYYRIIEEMLGVNRLKELKCEKTKQEGAVWEDGKNCLELKYKLILKE